MRIKENYKEYLDYFIDTISFKGVLSLKKLEILAEYKEVGAEYYFCTYLPENEDFKEGKVTLIFWKPADDEDTILYIDKDMFYKFIVGACENYLKFYPENKEKIEHVLYKMNKDLY